MIKHINGAKAILIAFILLQATSIHSYADQTPSNTNHPEYLEEQRRINLKETSLSSAIRHISKVFEIPVATEPAILNGIRSDSIDGYFSITGALEKLLATTDIEYRVSSDGVILRRVRASDNSLTNEATEELTVYGSKYLKEVDIHKRKKLNRIQENLLSDQFTNFSTHNISEVLLQFPGINLTREAGEGREVSIRGGLPDFTKVIINGMQIMSNNDSPMDSRVQKKRDRSVDMNIFTQDIFSEVVVVKSYSAEDSPGAIGGTIELSTLEPASSDEGTLALSVVTGKNSMVDDLSHDFTINAAASGDVWSGLLAINSGRRSAIEAGTNTFRWRQIEIPKAIVEDLDPEIADVFSRGDVLFPRGNRYSVWMNERERETYLAKLQRTSATSNLNLTLMNVVQRNLRQENHLFTSGNRSTSIEGRVSRFLDAEITPENYLNYLYVSDGSIATESRIQDVKSNYKQATLSNAFHLNQATRINLFAGIQDSKYDIPLSQSVITEGTSDIVLDYRDDRFNPKFTYSSDTSDPSTWSMREIDIEAYFSRLQSIEARASLDYEISPNLVISSGLRLNRMSNREVQGGRNNLFTNNWELFREGERYRGPEVAPIDDRVLSHLSYTVTNHPSASWLGVDVRQTLETYSKEVGAAIHEIDNMNFNVDNAKKRVSENTYSSYAQLDWQMSFLGRPSSLQLGARVVLSEADVYFPIKGSDNIGSSEVNEVFLLPSSIFTHELTKSNKIKIALSKNYSRPTFSDIMGTPEVNTSARTITGPNPLLASYKVVNLDAEFERNYGAKNYFSLGFFGKWFDDYIASERTYTTYRDTGLPIELLSDGLNADTEFERTQSTNILGAKMYGAEILFQKNLDFISSSLRNLNISGQLTLLEGKVNYYNSRSGEFYATKSFPFLAETMAGIQLSYDSGGFSASVNNSYKSDYITDSRDAESVHGYRSQHFVDASIRYSINARIEIQLTAFNLLDTPTEEYIYELSRPYNTTYTGRSYYLGFKFM